MALPPARPLCAPLNPIKGAQDALLSTIPAMNAPNAFPNETRVFFWGPMGNVEYGTVKSTSRRADGMQLVVVKVDEKEGQVTLPVSSLFKVI